MTPGEWSVSGLCVTVRPEDLEKVEVLLNRLPDIEVHASDPHSGRLVVAQERASIEERTTALRHLQSLPNLLTAELVIHDRTPPPGRPTPKRSGGTP